MRPELPPDYRPSDDEEFMNPLQIEYFRQKLLRWRAELLPIRPVHCAICRKRAS